jgi:class 3 adenylate cyclase
MNSSEIIDEVKAILRGTWKRTNGRTVPDTEELTLTGNHGIEISGAVLYADMTDSTALVDRFRDEFAAEIYKAYLLSACRVIRNSGGEITAFDGDRVMAVFVGDGKNSKAAKCALHMNFMVKEVNKAIVAQYPNSTFALSHCVGIDTSQLLVARTGIRQYNDLVWVGPAANYAAKLSAMNEPGYPTFIMERVYKLLNETSKYGGSPRKDMWEKRTWTQTGQTIYRSGWSWSF